MSRTLERSIARREYAKFAKRWRDEKRLAGIYGKAGYKRPSFGEWSAIHQRNLEMMKQSQPADVVEYLGADPWAEPAKKQDDLAFLDSAGTDEPKEERGVMTIDIVGNGDE